VKSTIRGGTVVPFYDSRHFVIFGDRNTGIKPAVCERQQYCCGELCDDPLLACFPSRLFHLKEFAVLRRANLVYKKKVYACPDTDESIHWKKNSAQRTTSAPLCSICRLEPREWWGNRGLVPIRRAYQPSNARVNVYPIEVVSNPQRLVYLIPSNATGVACGSSD